MEKHIRGGMCTNEYLITPTSKVGTPNPIRQVQVTLSRPAAHAVRQREHGGIEREKERERGVGSGEGGH